MKFTPKLAITLFTIATSIPAITLADEIVKWPTVPTTLYTLSNDATSNAVHAYKQGHNGDITLIGQYPTGGKGTGAGLGNQGALAISENERYLFAVNPGSDEISVFEINKTGLQLLDHVGETGKRPVSITVHDNLIYVVNAGDDSIFGYKFDSQQGRLQALNSSYLPLSGKGTGAAQISFNDEGDVLVVTEKATNKLSSYYINEQGLPESSHVIDSAGNTPFGFYFGKRNQLFVSEAQGGGANPNGGSVSSYEVEKDGMLKLIDGQVKNLQTASCWLITTPNGRIAYTADTPANAISSYQIDFSGHLKLAQSKATDASRPTDLAISKYGNTLFALNNGSHTLTAYGVKFDGTLLNLNVSAALPPFATGLVAR